MMTRMPEEHVIKNVPDERPVLLVDGLNAFCRCYAAFPSMSAHGYQMGGAVGFLKTLRKLVTDIQPRAVYVAWEGGGSSKRRSIYSSYKMQRRPEKLNRFYEDDIPDTDENKMHQIVALLGFLKCAPVCQVYVSNCEGDDVIAYLSKGPFLSKKKVIASSDKDLLQLLDSNTTVYSFHKKRYVTPSDVMDEFRVLPENFAVAKALCGDPSDNIPGVKGVGFKTVAKRLPVLGTDPGLTLQDVFAYCSAHREESSVFEKIIDAEADVRRNWQLVNLGVSTLSGFQTAKIDHVINTFEPKSDYVALARALAREGISGFDINDFFYSFNCIDRAY